jgi:hypothetical protein
MSNTTVQNNDPNIIGLLKRTLQGDMTEFGRLADFIRKAPENFVEDLHQAALQEHNRESSSGGIWHERQAKNMLANLSPQEGFLLDKINEGLPANVWERFHLLVARRRDDTLSSEEHAELVELTNRIEVAHARRMESVWELAKLRNKTLSEMLDELKIPSPGHV